MIKCLCFDVVKNSEKCTFRFRKLYVSFSRLYNIIVVYLVFYTVIIIAEKIVEHVQM